MKYVKKKLDETTPWQQNHVISPCSKRVEDEVHQNFTNSNPFFLFQKNSVLKHAEDKKKYVDVNVWIDSTVYRVSDNTTV